MITVALLVCLVGLLVWLINLQLKNGKSWISEMAKIAYAAGLLAWLLNLGTKTLP